MKDIINMGKIPAKERFKYKRSLQILMVMNQTNDEEKIKKASEEHCSIVKQIEKEMNLPKKIEEYSAEGWKFMIDDHYIFWLMSQDYVCRNFINKGDKKNGR